MGVGTLLYAVAIGPLTHVLLPVLTIEPRTAEPVREPEPEPAGVS